MSSFVQESTTLTQPAYRDVEIALANPQDSAMYIPPYRLPASAGEGGGTGMDVSGFARRVPINHNVALLFFKAFHYGQRVGLQGRVYSAYQPVLGFSEWLR